MRSWKRGLVLGSALLCALSASARADLYTWRTEDGGYAYTDDAKKIPARYKAQAKRVAQKSLASYERYTPQDADASARYAERLERRLASMREANDMAQEIERTRETPQQTVVMSAGGPYAPQITANVNDDAPMVVEPVLIRETGDLRTRRATVIRQGGKIIALLKDSQHNYNVSEDILDEAELEAGNLR